MRLLVVKVGSSGVDDRVDTAAALRSAGASEVEIRTVEPLAEQLDAALAALDGRRVVIEADLGGLNAVLARMMRRGELASVETAVLPRARIPYLSSLGLPGRRAEQLQLAVSGRARLVGVVKDDSGGVCVDSATLTPWPSHPGGQTRASFSAPGDEKLAQVRRRGWWVRAVVDDQRLCDGQVSGLRVRRLGPSELEATAQLGRYRSRTRRGRSLQLACDPALITADGIERERPRSKRTFWSEPALWQLALADRPTT